MRHFAVTAACAICFWLLILLCIAWPVTWQRPVFAAIYGPTGKPKVVGIGWGEVYVISSNISLGTDLAWSMSIRCPSIADAATEQSQIEDMTVKHGGLGFSIGEHQWVMGDPTLYYGVVAAPIWAVIILPLLVSLHWARSLRRLQRTRKGLCLQCGYDLRATRSRCPECGLVPKPKRPIARHI